jgi:glucose dehydrogenase
MYMCALLLAPGAGASGASFSRTNSATIQEDAEGTPSPTAAAAAKDGDDDIAGHDIVWLRYSDVGLFSQPDDMSQAKLGTFYQVLDAASGLEVWPHDSCCDMSHVRTKHTCVVCAASAICCRRASHAPLICRPANSIAVTVSEATIS